MAASPDIFRPLLQEVPIIVASTSDARRLPCLHNLRFPRDMQRMLSDFRVQNLVLLSPRSYGPGKYGGAGAVESTRPVNSEKGLLGQVLG